jgi:hypothetical protein
MNQRRGHWYLLTGLIIGAALGLGYAWLVQPVEYTHTSPASLRQDYKDHYRAMIAMAYLANGDLVRAQARLDLLKDADVYRMLAEQAQRTMAQGSAFDEARALGMLAEAIKAGVGVGYEGGHTGIDARLTPEINATVVASLLINEGGWLINETVVAGATPTSTLPASVNPTSAAQNTAVISDTLNPSQTPTITPGALFVLAKKEQVCDPALGQGLVQVLTLDTDGQPVAGVEVIITWDGGEDHFFTGLYPEISPGYADFRMMAGITYTLRLAQGRQPIGDLIATQCRAPDGKQVLANWYLEFIQP